MISIILSLKFRQFLKAIKVTKLSEVNDKCKEYDVIAIDEG